MKSKSCGWRGAHSLGHRSYGSFGGSWLRGKPRMKGDDTRGVSSYMDHVANAASFEAFNRREEAEILLSAEALPENSSFLSFAAFAKDHPERFFKLVSHLRPEFQELCIEYYVLNKSQSFIGQAHGFIQTRTWQALRIIEQAIGAMILIGAEPRAQLLMTILTNAGLESTEHGSLTKLILLYAEHRNYTRVAKIAKIPVATVRKIFRPAIAKLLADKDIHSVAVGAYLRSMTHQASLTRTGLSRSCLARLKRVKTLHFVAPSADNSPLISFGSVDQLADLPWCMLELSSDHRMAQLSTALRSQAKSVFGKKAAQIFAPVTSDGELQFGYIFARCMNSKSVRSLTRIRGISDISAVYNDDGAFLRPITIPNSDVQEMIRAHQAPEIEEIHSGHFVEILTGPAAKYCGTVLQAKKNKVIVQVDFPTGRKFIVTADTSCVKWLPEVSRNLRAFWGVREN